MEMYYARPTLNFSGVVVSCALKYGIPVSGDLTRCLEGTENRHIQPLACPCGYTYPIGKCCHDAIRRLEMYKQEGYKAILDADIQAFYDTIPHKLIMDRLREKIADGWVLNSIENMLKAGV
ncbi:MAG: hypothetical protein V1753_03920, partial [Pseudomonadota bacterium]